MGRTPICRAPMGRHGLLLPGSDAARSLCGPGISLAGFAFPGEPGMKPGSGGAHESGCLGDVRSAAAGLLGLEGLDLLDAVDHPTTNLDVAGALANPAPALKRAWADAPAAGQVDLVQVFDGHGVLQQAVTKTCGDDGVREERKPTRSEG